ncbi:acetyl-CoA carboxylase biotin carboxyl carrier protein [Pseudonocardia dioxanivorans]|uniref:Biotin carboxyl carrier protein of acetyl-CoA carboxylase n=2 Tax=Pseudonocardia TaxID=1847 RepID=F4CVG3_PSEUX|nr:biotin/lipoyl-containing protein [Pseudonocardia dioxanivorans]AEA23783.1 acetyl-CoA carboxylase, biotin carboxyl carrier protein [Pseudonocardia dioxanivorans CB1190]GJF06505.1 acetyl-CoA carboxylase biotin carboxyl carrier protein subunit [Pseudonocardia sp. D17]
MPVGQDGLKRVLDAFEQGDWDEIHLVADDVEVHLVARGADSKVQATSHVTAPEETPARTTDVAPSAPMTATAEDATTVVAPSPGLFWRAPSPGAPPFTDIGGHVEEGTALCIVEVMKLMNTLPAPVAGTVVEICAENGEQVDTGTPLFRIRADGS